MSSSNHNAVCPFVCLSTFAHIAASPRNMARWSPGPSPQPTPLALLGPRCRTLNFSIPRFDRICPNLHLLFELHEIWSVDSQENCGGAAGRLNSGRLEHTPKSPPLGLAIIECFHSLYLMNSLLP